ncbi:MAG: HPF/RaiA family ribosome-associated protein [Planctomycetota bacterium]
MQLEIRRQNVRLDDTMVEHIEKQMGVALNNFESWLRDVQVSLEDVNGPKGGVDKQCRVLVNLRSGKMLKVEDTAEDWTTVVNRTADRVGHVVAKEVGKRREH